MAKRFLPSNPINEAMRTHEASLNLEDFSSLEEMEEHVKELEMIRESETHEMRKAQERMRRKQIKHRVEGLKKVLSEEEKVTKGTKLSVVQIATKCAKSLKIEIGELEVKKLELQTRHQELQDKLCLLNSSKSGDDVIARDWESSQMYTCDADEDCNFTADDVDDMFQHEQAIHIDAEPFICDHRGCRRSFPTMHALSGHKQNHESANLSLKKAHALANEKGIHEKVNLLENTETFKCDQKFCYKTFTSRDKYVAHAYHHRRCQEMRSSSLRSLNGMEQQIWNKGERSHVKGDQGTEKTEEKGGQRIVYRCEKPLGVEGKLCNKIFVNIEVMRVHEFIHEELMLFKCPIQGCNYIYGLPSKLKKHVQLYHLNNENTLKIFRSEDLKPLLFEERKRINCNMQQAFAIGDETMFLLMNNFLEAVIDAKIMMDEVETEIDMDNQKETKILLNEMFPTGLKVVPDGLNYFKQQNIQFVERNNVISRLDYGDGVVEDYGDGIVECQNKDNNCISQMETEPDIEEVVVKIESDQELIDVIDEQETNLIIDDKEPDFVFDGVINADTNLDTTAITHDESEDELDKIAETLKEND